MMTHDMLNTILINIWCAAAVASRGLLLTVICLIMALSYMR